MSAASGRRLEDHLPPAAVAALQEQSVRSGWSVRELALADIAISYLQQARHTLSRHRIALVREMLAELVQSDLRRRDTGDRRSALGDRRSDEPADPNAEERTPIAENGGDDV